MSKKSLLELYEQDLLSEPEKQAFLQLVAQHQERERLREILNAPQPVLTVRRIRWAAVASVLCVAIGWWMVSKSILPIAPQPMFAQVAAPSSPDIIQMGTPTVNVNEIVKHFVALYDAKKYSDCVTLAADIPKEDKELTILLAYSYMQQGDYPKSIAILERYYAHPEFAKDEVRWWLGLAHGLNGNILEMKKYLRQIQPEQYHYAEAQKLL